MGWCMRQANFGYIVRKKSYYAPDDVAIVEHPSGTERTYGELERRSNSVAQELQARGIGADDTVAGLFRNSAVFFDVFFATCKLGAVAAPMNYRLAPPELDYLLDDSDPDLFIYESVFEDTVSELDLGSVPEARVGEANDPAVDAADFATFYDHDGTTEVPVAEGFDETAVLLYTSGSTGRPKGVPLTHKNIFFASVDYVVDLELGGDDATVTSSPVFHVGGLNVFTLPLLHAGGTVVLQQEFEPAETWELFADYSVTKVFLIPTMLNAMVNVDGWRDYDLSSLELVVGGGEPVPSKLTEALASIDVPCVAAFGLTETTDGSLFLRPEYADDKPPECNGKTFTHADAKVVDQDGTEQPPGEPGELLHRGPTVAERYLERPDETAEAWDGEWFRTGDIAVVDEDGFYHIRGRVDNMIISGGENIYPSEVEDALYSHPDVADVVVFGVSDEEWGEIVKAVIVPDEGATLSREDIREFLTGDLARFKHPKEITVVDDLPKSGTGKVERDAVLERYGDG